MSTSAETTLEGSSPDPDRFDLLVIGGGSGGLACAKRAASFGARVCVVEGHRYGGTCVNVGCVPKKVMFNTSAVLEAVHQANQFGITTGPVSFDWSALKASRDAYITRLNGIYESGLDKLQIVRLSGWASLQGGDAVRVSLSEGVSRSLSAKHILLATGGQPMRPEIPGQELMLDSDGFFSLSQQPRRVAVIGAGYIAVELAGVLNGLGTDTTLVVRGPRALRSFDSMLSEHLDTSMKAAGINVVSGAVLKSVQRDNSDGSLSLSLEDGRSLSGFDVVLCAIGRRPNLSGLNLQATSVVLTASGHIEVDEWQNTSQAGVHALGDVCGKVELTPMAIAAGRRLADRLFGNMPTAKADYSNVPTVVFSHPVIGCVGMTEAEARAMHGDVAITVYNSSFVNLYYGSFYGGGMGPKPTSRFKLVCLGAEQRILGLHCIGMGSDELLQGFAVALKMGATKADFDACVAIHPTAAEELVTMPPWGLGGTPSAHTGGGR